MRPNNCSGFSVEYGHVYLNEIESGKFDDGFETGADRTPQCNHLQDMIDLFDSEDIPYDLVVSIDDTSSQYADQVGSPSFETFRNELAQRYINQLPIKPDGYYFESDFGGVLEALIEMLPEVNAGELGHPDSWGVFRNEAKESVYLYGSHEPGETKPKVKLVDRTAESGKVTPYTCAAYDTAMSVTKFGLLGGPDTFVASPHAISLYNNSFYRSQPFRKSMMFQRLLFDQDIVPIKTYTPPRHLTVGPQDTFDTISSFIMDCKTLSADRGPPEYERPL